jgi:hypothetical protein
MSESLLTIITRHWPGGRPESFKRMMATVEAQTDPDFDHQFEYDHEGRGLKWADANMAEVIPRLTGRYIWVVDDDDLLEPDAVEVVKKALIANDYPDVLVVKGEHGRYGILPRDDVWQSGKPVWGGISGQDVIVKRELAHQFAYGWAHPPIGDVAYIERIWATYPRIVWYSRLVVRQQRNGLGRAEWED